ncbi:peptidoglycan DD-metalloendopeptidase family protein [Caloramator sp. ALD01]|uniref:peptidoglycan DD-metalloendopeptidase family protein n=1 Tax=Caloramator sp. ALD01 TaxID=1031288 RepID=UPI000418D2D7|nr:peptidoglycan DD-metalloendopeptidase family protein [Caloramator sp. ALD01]
MYLLGKIQKKLSIASLVGVLLGLFLSLFAVNLQIKSNSIYMVKVLDKEIGYVKGVEVVKNVKEKIKMTDGIDLSRDVKVIAEKESNKHLIDEQELEVRLRKEFKLKIPVYVVKVGNNQIAVLASKRDYEALIETIKNRYIPKYDKTKNVEIKSFKIDENLLTTIQYVDAALVEDVDDVAEKIIKGKLIEEKYVVKQGDTIWNISLDKGISIDEIATYNPNINLDKIKIGQEILIVRNEPFFNVEIDVNIVSDEEVPYEEKQIYDKTMNKGKKIVKEEGKNGLAEVTKNIKIVNGDVVEETIVSSKLIEEPKNSVVVIGTKQSQLVATGMFIRPSRGYISSYFGRRWGRMHQGVDLAGPTGTPIYAADTGKVVFAGWMGTYGKCIMIDHGNGYRTVYGHASKLYVSEGTRVTKGQLIAAVGSTGRSTGPHLHFEIRKNGVPQNPLKYIK